MKAPTTEDLKEKATLAYLRVTNPEEYKLAKIAAEKRKAGGGIIEAITDAFTG